MGVGLALAHAEVGTSHLVLLGELEAVVGFETLDVVGQVSDGDGWVVSHTWGGHTRVVSTRGPRRQCR